MSNSDGYVVFTITQRLCCENHHEFIIKLYIKYVDEIFGTNKKFKDQLMNIAFDPDVYLIKLDNKPCIRFTMGFRVKKNVDVKPFEQFIKSKLEDNSSNFHSWWNKHLELEKLH